MYMSQKLAKWIESEFDRNAWFFSEFKGGLIASCDFIDYVLKDNENLKIDEYDKEYITTIRECYSNLKRLSDEMVEEIGKYKHAFSVLFADEEIIYSKKRTIVKNIKPFSTSLDVFRENIRQGKNQGFVIPD